MDIGAFVIDDDAIGLLTQPISPVCEAGTSNVTACITCRRSVMNTPTVVAIS